MAKLNSKWFDNVFTSNWRVVRWVGNEFPSRYYEDAVDEENGIANIYICLRKIEHEEKNDRLIKNMKAEGMLKGYGEI